MGLPPRDYGYHKDGTEKKWKEALDDGYHYCIHKLCDMAIMLDNRPKHEVEEKVDLLQSSTWSDLLKTLLDWHENLMEQFRKEKGKLDVDEHDALTRLLDLLKDQLDDGFEQIMVFVNLEPLERISSQTDMTTEQKKAAEYWYKCLRFGGGMPQMHAGRAVADLCRTLKDPEYQQRGSDMLTKIEEEWTGWHDDWIIYTKKHWEETYRVEWDEWLSDD
ncbi:MAG: hypothetical protein OHK93_007447 [Ramalina farinacea]|uniref:Uncharacterized protein n=1 Tax=Ramalina farinacea TaxID=258253 RepID=A0AA43QKH7_9LECA|nr:hypothetical protein [Ramalina farinacea]